MKIDLKGKVAIVTGGSRGIGAACALMLAEAGATVAVNFVRNEKAARSMILSAHRKRYGLFLVPGDVSDFLVAEHVVHWVLERTERLDILVNNAGIWEANPLDNPRSEEAWDRTIKMNLKSAYNMCVHATPHLAKAKGRIINIGSTAGQRGEAGYSHYAASKAGIVGLTKSLAIELAPQQILANCVAPGWVWTDMTKKVLRTPARRKEILAEIPLGKVAQPEDVAGAVLFLSSSLSTHITGAVLSVNGGSVLDG